MNNFKKFVAAILIIATVLSIISIFGVTSFADEIDDEIEETDKRFSNGPQADRLIQFMVNQVGEKSRDEVGNSAMCAGTISAGAKVAGLTQNQINLSATLASPFIQSYCFGFLLPDGTLQRDCQLWTWKDFVEGRYQPLRGDIIFYGTLSTANMTVEEFASHYNTFTNVHVGVIRDNTSTTSVLHTIEGNVKYNNTPNSTSLKNRSANPVTGAALTSSYVTVFARPRYDDARYGYVADCTYYPCSTTITATKNVDVLSAPCTPDVDSTSEIIGQLKKGDIFTSTYIWRNTLNNYWYEISYNGQTGFVYSGRFNAEANDDATISASDLQYPMGERPKGKSLPLSGIVKSDVVRMKDISAYVYAADDTERTTPQTGMTYTLDSYYYSIKNSVVNTACNIGSLDEGDYTYVLSVRLENYTANNNELQKVVVDKDVVVSDFSVDESFSSPLYFTAQPQDFMVEEGGYAIFKPVVEGSNLSYQWEFSKDNGITWNESVFTTANYKAITSASWHGWLFRCVVSDDQGNSITSDAARLTIISSSNGLKYIRNTDDTLTIIKYTGNDSYVTIPQEIKGRTVTAIDNGAFYNCKSLTRVEIPQSVISAASSAFYGSNLHTVYGFAGSYAEDYAKLKGYNFYVLNSDITFNHSCSLGSSLSLIYYTPTAPVKGFDNIRLHIEKNKYNADGTSFVVDEYDITDYTITDDSGVERFRFVFDHIAAKEMGDEIAATLFAEKDGIVYASKREVFSVRMYAMNQLDMTTNCEFKTLLVDMLNYGAQAQMYFGYRTNNLANDDLTGVHRLYQTSAEPILKSLKKVVPNTDATAFFNSNSLVLENQIVMKYYLVIGDEQSMDNVSVKFTYITALGDKKTVSIPASSFDYDETTGRYSVRLQTVAAKDADQPVTATIYDGNTPISDEFTYSIGTYAFNISQREDMDPSLQEIVYAMMRYCQSAETYFITRDE